MAGVLRGRAAKPPAASTAIKAKKPVATTATDKKKTSKKSAKKRPRPKTTTAKTTASASGAMKKTIDEARSVEEFLDITFAFAEQDIVLFRGQRRVSWELQPTLARIQVRTAGETPLDIERRLMRSFRRQYLPYMDREVTDDWELLAVAQHHGLNTRMLDWTGNPLAALWFAVRKPAEGESGAVFMFQPAREDYADAERQRGISPYDVNRTLFFQPAHQARRIVAQSGWLSVHSWNDAESEFIGLDKLGRYSDAVKRVHIPPDAFCDIRDHLDRIGVNEANLFPDLDGLCTHLNWSHSLLGDEVQS